MTIQDSKASFYYRIILCKIKSSDIIKTRMGWIENGFLGINLRVQNIAIAIIQMVTFIICANIFYEENKT